MGGLLENMKRKFIVIARTYRNECCALKIVQVYELLVKRVMYEICYN